MSNDKEKVSRLQVIDPVLLTNILQRVDENATWQSISNILDQSGLNKIVNDYDKYLKLPSDSGLKDTFRMNLLSRDEIDKGCYLMFIIHPEVEMHRMANLVMG